MAATSIAMSSATFTNASSVVTAGRQGRKRTLVKVEGLNSFGGLKAQNSVASLGLPVCTEKSFANVVSSLKTGSKGKGGALTSTCSVAAEIFQISSVMCGLTLVGVAVGFVLLRVEAFVEEAE
ncbi:hypothetical protein MKW94_008086 [Papaver nudicaule]|uniref:Cytochrome b6-f complex subunit 7 n=1 Tax=Papaver nudicaule TaxID=74823 RepID=A0AA41VWP0_PAPNU|nr:hypothetical protein [Papaver nudicaule]